MEDYLTTAEVGKRFRAPAGTVRYWRHIGYGPKGIKIGRRVLYPVTEVRRFEDELRRSNGVPAA